MFVDLAVSRRLERAEGHACMQFAAARHRLFPANGSAWMECAGAYVVFDGADSPVTQSFGLGLFEPLSDAVLSQVEAFFFDRGAPSQLEISPFAGVGAAELLCRRGYRPLEISNVLARPVEDPGPDPSNLDVRLVSAGSYATYTEVSARAWCHEHPELQPYFEESGAIAAAREGSVCFLAECEGIPGAAASLCTYEGVALFAGAATVPEFRRRGLQAALLRERLRHAFQTSCDLAMMAAEPGSESHRNAERRGFRIAYTRLKWCLKKP